VTAVGVNLLWLVPGVVGGTETYAVRLLRAIEAHGGRHEPVLFALPAFPDAHPDLAAAFEVVVAPVSGRRRPLRVGVESTWLLNRARRMRLPLLHHLGGTAPVGRGVPAVLTVHDLQYRTYPHHFAPAKRRFLEAMVPRSVRRARVVATPSDYVRGTVIDAFGVAPERVVTVPVPVDPRPRPAADHDEVLERYGLVERGFFLYPAIDAYPHKNHAVVARAMASVAERHPDARLVFTGRAPAGSDPGVVTPGFVPGDHLEALYELAAAVVFPSRYEGFGAGVLEAMARGCPVIAADATALPGTVGDGGVLVAPDDADGWAAAMCDMLEDETARAELAAAARRRANHFDPDRSAALLDEVYARALET
jgi:alpha-1,3-rhamnosyl/mannosyltransferase